MRVRSIACALTFAAVFGTALDAQENPRMRRQATGLGVSPTFEGWYPNPDGTFTLSWGFFNRNTEETLHIPIGPNNSVSPGPADQGQATYFTPDRSYGVFTVTVPADFGNEARVSWVLEINGERWETTGGLIHSYHTDNLYAKAIDRYPPLLVMEDGGEETAGPNGARVGPLSTTVGEPLELKVESWDQQGHGVTVRWYKYRGPGGVEFTADAVTIEEGSREAVTSVSFDEPGEYVLYVRADHSDVRVSAAGLEQCCWTNGYVSVSVSR